MILIQFFAQFQETLRFVALPQVRTQIIERARYRIPEVVLCSLPVPKCKILDVVPGAVIEILSPTDHMGETLERFRDYAASVSSRSYKWTRITTSRTDTETGPY